MDAINEFAWVIEHDASDAPYLLYWAGPNNWTQNNLEAIRFSRRLDADRVARIIGGNHRVCEHGWCTLLSEIH
jgi:hypothetical protein